MGVIYFPEYVFVFASTPLEIILTYFAGFVKYTHVLKIKFELSCTNNCLYANIKIGKAYETKFSER